VSNEVRYMFQGLLVGHIANTEYCQSKKIDIAGHIVRLPSNVVIQWVRDKGDRRLGHPRKTNIPGRSARDASQLEWCWQSGL